MFGMPGALEMVMIVVLGTGLGLPLGVPPAAEDPMLAKVAPEQCLFYTTWSGMAEPDGTSQNQTERLLAEPEIHKFVGAVNRLIDQAVAKATRNMPPPDAAARKAIPVLGRTILTHPTALFIEHVQIGRMGPTGNAALIVNIGDQRQAFQQAIAHIEATIPEGEVHDVKINGASFRQGQPGPAAPVLTWGFKDKYFIFALGEGTMAGLLQRAATPAPKWLSKLRSAMPVDRPCSVTFLNVKTPVEMVCAMGGPTAQVIIEQVGLSSVASYASVTGLDDQGTVAQSRIVFQGKATGLIKSLTSGNLTLAELKTIPKDAAFVVAYHLDLANIVDELVKTVRKTEPAGARQLESGIAQMDQVLGFDVKADLLGALGTCWTAYATPIQSSNPFEGVVISVDLRNQAKFEKAHGKLLTLAKALLARQSNWPTINTTKSNDVTIHTMEVPGGETPFKPAWCIANKRLVIALSPKTLDAVLGRSASDTSIADRPEVAKLFAGDSKPLAIKFDDTARQFRRVYPLARKGIQMLADALAKQGLEIDPPALPAMETIASHLQPSTTVVRTRDGTIETVGRATYAAISSSGAVPVAVALLLPAVQAARASARRMQSMNNLKQILLSMHNYYDTHRGFPPASITDASGKPLLSWRVLLLPYMEQGQLYNQFHFDEPWNSPHNKKLIAMMPDVYKALGSNAKPGTTVYLGNAMKGGVFVPPTGDNRGAKTPIGITLRDIKDGSSNTIALVEASDAKAVVWTKPEDFVPDKQNPLQGLVGLRVGGFLAALADGSVHFVSQSIDQKVLRGLLTRDGNERLDR